MLDLLPVTPETTVDILTEPPMQPPSTAGMTTRVVKGSLWTLAGQIAPLAVALVTTPFVIRILGSEGYGVVVLVGLIPAYLTFTDLGMGFASTKFGSEAFGLNRPEEEAQVVTTASVIAFLTALPFGIAIFAFSLFWVTVLNVPEHLRPEASLAFKFAAVILVVNVLSNVVNTPQLARLRMDLNTFVTASFRIVGSVLALVIVYLGWGISGAVFAVMVASLLTFIGQVAVSGRLNPAMLRPAIDRNLIRPLLGFGGALALSGIAAVLLVNLEKLVLTTQTSVQTLAYYSVAFTFSNVATLFSLSMGQSLMPAFSQLLTPDRREHLESLYHRALRISIFGMLPMVAIMYVAGRPFFTIWAGEEFGRESTWPFYLLLIGLFFNIIAYIPAGLILAGGRTDLIAKLYWIELFPYIAVTAILAGRFGAVGAAAAWSLRVVVDAIIYFVLANKTYRLRHELLPLIPKLLFGIAVLLPPIVLAIFYMNFAVSLIALLVSLSIYGLVVWRTVMALEEKTWLESRLNRLAIALRLRTDGV